MLYRFDIALAIPEAVYDAIPIGQRMVIMDRIRQLKAYAVNINAGATNEEMTTKAKWHKCYNDEVSRLCEPEQDI